MRRQFRLWAIIVGSLLGGASLLGVVVKAVIGPREPNYYGRPWVPPPTPATTRADLASASPSEFGPSLPPDPADAAMFQSILDTIGNPNGFRRPWEVQQQFSFDRMAEELARLGVYRATGRTPTVKSISDDATTFQNAVSGLLGRPEGPLTWEQARVVRVARSAAGDEAVVLARHVVKAGTGEQVQYRRWWMRNETAGSATTGWRSAGWHVYDFDEPGTRLRYTVTLAGVMADGSFLTQPAAGSGPAVLLNTESGLLLVQAGGRDDEGVVDLRDSLSAAADGDREAAAAKVAASRRWRMVSALGAVREVAEGRRLALEGRPDEALKRFDAALKTWPDTPAAHIGRAVAHNDLKNYQAALFDLNNFRSRVGDDPEAAREEARARVGLGKPAAAIKALRGAIKDFPGSVGLLVEWYRQAPPAQRGEAGEWAASAPNPGTTLMKLLRRIETDDPAEAAAVVAGYQRVRPREPVGLVCLAQVQVRQGRAAAAAESLRAGLTAMGDDERRVKALEEFARAMARANRAADGYDAAARAGQAEGAFRPLAEAALSAGRGPAAGGLAAVIDAHAGKYPADPWPHYYRAALHRLAGDHAAAERQLADGMKKLAPPPARTTRLDPPPDGLAPGESVQDLDGRERDWATFRTARAASLHRLGKWRQAYDELAPQVDTFDQLAGLLADDKNADGLRALIVAHQAAVPTDSAVPLWQAEAHFLRKDYPAVLASAIEYGQKNPEAPVPLRLADRWVRSQVRLGRPMEAMAMCGAIKADATCATLRALVAAAARDVPGTLAHLRDLRRVGGSPTDAYADPDLGPLLRGPAFAEVRKEFPPPKAN